MLVEGVLRRDGLAAQLALVVGGGHDAGLAQVRRLVQLQPSVARERRAAPLHVALIRLLTGVRPAVGGQHVLVAHLQGFTVS